MIIEKIVEHARRDPDRIAIYYGEHRISYGQFARWIIHAREFLIRRNLPSQGYAVLNLDCLLDSWVFGLALRSLGLTTIAVPSHQRLNDLGVPNAVCVVATERASPAPLPESAASAKDIRVAHHFYLGKNIDGPLPAFANAKPNGGHILLTSGTTGVSKKVLVDDFHLSTSIPRRADLFEIGKDSVVNVLGFAMWTSVGYNGPLCVWDLGCSVVIDQSNDTHRSLRAGAVTHVIATPMMLANLLAAPAGELQGCRDMRMIVGGGPLTAALATAAKERLTPHVFTFIGSTEIGPWTITKIERLSDLRSHHVPSYFDVQVVDDSGIPLPAGQVGIVRIRTMDGVTRYVDDPRATEAFFRDGFFYPGDMGAFQPDGRLALHGRVTNVINVLGDKKAAEPIEAALREALGADDVCILSMQGLGTDEELHVVVESRRKIGETELKSALHKELPAFPHARVHFMDAIPRNASGKIDRAAVRRLIAPKPQA